MPYIDAECPECSEQFEVYEDDDCDECSILEQQIADLENTQLSEEQEKKLEEYERLKTWILQTDGVKPSDLILGLDRCIVKIMSNFAAYMRTMGGLRVNSQEDIDVINTLVNGWMSLL